MKLKQMKFRLFEYPINNNIKNKIFRGENMNIYEKLSNVQIELKAPKNQFNGFYYLLK